MLDVMENLVLVFLSDWRQFKSRFRSYFLAQKCFNQKRCHNNSIIYNLTVSCWLSLKHNVQNLSSSRFLLGCIRMKSYEIYMIKSYLNHLSNFLDIVWSCIDHTLIIPFLMCVTDNVDALTSGNNDQTMICIINYVWSDHGHDYETRCYKHGHNAVCTIIGYHSNFLWVPQ